MRIWLVLFMVVFTQIVNICAQQLAQFSHYPFNKYLINPAYGGMERSLSVFAGYRDQYSAFPGNPNTFLCNADMPFYRLNGAAGFSLTNQSTGLFRISQVKISYNYVKGTNFGFLSFGARMGIEFLQLDGSAITTPEGDYESVINHNDPTLLNHVYSGTAPTWEAGMYFFNNRLEAGLTVGNFPGHQHGLGPGSYKRTSIVTAFGMHKYSLNEDMTLLSSCLIKWDNAALQSDLSALLKFRDQLTTGIGFRGYNALSADAVIIYLGTNVGKKYTLMYSYDVGVSALRSGHQGSHEITLSYNLQKMIGLGLPPKIIYNPRDL